MPNILSCGYEQSEMTLRKLVEAGQWRPLRLRCAGVKWALLRQPSASLLHLAFQRKGGRDGMGHRYGILRQKWRVHTWRGPTHEEEEEGDEEVEAVVEVSENKRGFRNLVCPQLEVSL